MTGGPTAFVTGTAGFIGIELIKVLLARGCQVFGLAASVESAQRLRRAGAVAVMGDLREPGRWQDEATTEWVFHIPPCAAAARSRWPGRAAEAARQRTAIDTHLLDAIVAGPTRRIVYVVDSRCFGSTGSRPLTEDELSVSPIRARGLTRALNRLDGYAIAGLPIVTAIPGCIYGDGSWFRERVIGPVMSGRRVQQFGKTGPWVSPIHVHDCARALVHLAERGEVGSRYILANNEPIRMEEFARAFARLANRPLRVWRLPAAVAGWLLERPLADLMQADAAFSNIRLRGTGFAFRYPTLDEGIEQILAALHE